MPSKECRSTLIRRIETQIRSTSATCWLGIPSHAHCSLRTRLMRRLSYRRAHAIPLDRSYPTVSRQRSRRIPTRSALSLSRQRWPNAHVSTSLCCDAVCAAPPRRQTPGRAQRIGSAESRYCCNWGNASVHPACDKIVPTALERRDSLGFRFSVR